MAILQSRMISLIDAAIDYYHAYTELSRMIHKAYNAKQEGKDPDELLTSLALAANDYSLLQNTMSINVIMEEFKHFKKNKARNEQQRQYQEDKREERGIPRQRTFYQPPHAKTEFSPLAEKLTAFEPGFPDLRDHLRHGNPKPKAKTIEEIAQELPQELSLEYQKAFERRNDSSEAQESLRDWRRRNGMTDEFDPKEDTIPKLEDPFQTHGLNREVDPDFPRSSDKDSK